MTFTTDDAYIVHGFRILSTSDGWTAADVLKNIPPWYVENYRLYAIGDHHIISFMPGARCVFGLYGELTRQYIRLMCEETAHIRALMNIQRLLVDGQKFGGYNVRKLSLFVFAEGRIIGDVCGGYHRTGTGMVKSNNDADSEQESNVGENK